MVDFHSHIIPGIDDGAKTVEDSLAMLKESYEKGVRITVLTPHFYPLGDNSLDEFLKKREECFNNLKNAVEKCEFDVPELRLGCEVNLSADINDYKGIEQLKIEGTDYILLEMSYKQWDEDTFDWIYKLKLKGFKPVMAHIDRYLSVPKKDLKNLFDLGLLYQVNADAFLNFGIKKEISKMLRRGLVHVLGSDMHNITERCNNLDKAMAVLKKQFGSEYIRFLTDNADAMIKNETPHMHMHAYLPAVSMKDLMFGKKGKE